MQWFKVDINAHANGVVDSLLAALIGALIAFMFKARNQVVRFLKMSWHTLVATVSGDRYVLIWNDVDIQYSCKLIQALEKRFRFRLLPIQAPSNLLNFHLGPRVVAAVLLIDTDVSKFATDPRLANRIERQLIRYLMRGGGIVGTHDVIYSRVRNQQLQAAFGCAITDFARSQTVPLKYFRTEAGRGHPMTSALPDQLELEDGEVIWGDWASDCTIHYETNYQRKTALLVSRRYLNGRLVWAHSGDKGRALAKSIAEPQTHFVDIVEHAISWVCRDLDERQTVDKQIVAHRGVAGISTRENTIPAFQDAINAGANYIEFDVRRTLDNVFIVHHDANVGGKATATHTFSELAPQALMAGYELPTLVQVLNLCKDKVRLDVELKEEGYEEDFLRSVREVIRDHEFVVTSFSDLSIRRIKVQFSAIRCGLILGKANPQRPLLTRLNELYPKARLRRCRADFVVPNIRLMRFGFSKRMRSIGVPIWAWTINDPASIQKLLRDKSVEAIITDKVSLVTNISSQADCAAS